MTNLRDKIYSAISHPVCERCQSRTDWDSSDCDKNSCHDLYAEETDTVLGIIEQEQEVHSQKLREAYSPLRKILRTFGGKNDGLCPLCASRNHKSWCWYPEVLSLCNYPLDKYDLASTNPQKDRRCCPNPECGSETSLIVNYEGAIHVTCVGCGMRGPSSEFVQKAVKLWNALPR